MIRSEFGVKTWKHGSILPCLNGSGWWYNGVGGIFLAHFEPLSTNWVSFKRHSLPEYCCWPCPSLYDYSVPIFWCYFSRIMHRHKAQIISDWFLEHAMSSLYSNDLHSHQISINRAPLGCGGTRDSHLVFSRQICSNCVMLSCQYGPKSLRNVYNTLLNLRHEELRQFWRQKGVQPGTSKVYLIKWPVYSLIKMGKNELKTTRV